MISMATCVRSLALLLAVVFATSSPAKQFAQHPHKVIYVCSDESWIADEIRRQIPASYVVLDGNVDDPVSEATFVYIGRPEGTALSAKCTAKFPEADHYLAAATQSPTSESFLQHLRKDLQQKMTEKHPAALALRTIVTSQWDQQGPTARWYVSYCFLPKDKMCPLDMLETLVEMAAENPAP